MISNPQSELVKSDKIFKYREIEIKNYIQFLTVGKWDIKTFGEKNYGDVWNLIVWEQVGKIGWNFVVEIFINRK